MLANKGVKLLKVDRFGGNVSKYFRSDDKRYSNINNFTEHFVQFLMELTHSGPSHYPPISSPGNQIKHTLLNTYRHLQTSPQTVWEKLSSEQLEIVKKLKTNRI